MKSNYNFKNKEKLVKSPGSPEFVIKDRRGQVRKLLDCDVEATVSDSFSSLLLEDEEASRQKEKSPFPTGKEYASKK